MGIRRNILGVWQWSSITPSAHLLADACDWSAKPVHSMPCIDQCTPVQLCTHRKLSSHLLHWVSACFADQTPINQRGVVQFTFDGAMDEELTVDQGEEVSLHARHCKPCWHMLHASACSILHASPGPTLCQLYFPVHQYFRARCMTQCLSCPLMGQASLWTHLNPIC